MIVVERVRMGERAYFGARGAGTLWVTAETYPLACQPDGSTRPPMFALEELVRAARRSR